MKKTLLITLFVLSLLNTSYAQEGMIGEIKLFAGNFAPSTWAICNGQLLPISQNQALFSILGTTYGGDGRNTFALPDLRGRVPVSPGQGPGLSNYVLGQQTGAESITLNVNQLPSHNHIINAVKGTGDSSSPTGNYIADTGLFDKEYSTTNTIGSTQLHSGSVGNTGSGQSVENRQPTLAINYITRCAF